MKTPKLFVVACALCVAPAGAAVAEICDPYRSAIDTYFEKSRAFLALDDALDAAREGLRATRNVREALKVLDRRVTREVLESWEPGANERLDEAAVASSDAIASFESVYRLVKDAVEDRSATGKAELNAARLATDAAADPALDSLGTLKAVPRRGALKAASASASASPGRTTTGALLSVYESIYRAACR